MANLVGITEIAAILGVSSRTAHRLVNRKDFPKPVHKLRSGRVWDRAAVKAWAKQPPVPLDRKPGRPPKAS
jgi:predicted DNA-binding transcriptional regulator AlpA